MQTSKLQHNDGDLCQRSLRAKSKLHTVSFLCKAFMLHVVSWRDTWSAAHYSVLVHSATSNSTYPLHAHTIYIYTQMNDVIECSRTVHEVTTHRACTQGNQMIQHYITYTIHHIPPPLGEYYMYIPTTTITPTRHKHW